MKRFAFFALSFLLVCCSSQDKTSTRPATLEVNIDQVGATKVWFSVESSDPDAAYLYRGVSDYDQMDDYVEYTDSDRDIITKYLESLGRIYEMSIEDGSQIASFQDAFCFKGSRSFNMVHIGPDMKHRIIACQINPETRTIIGEPVGVEFKTNKSIEIPMEFDVSVDGDVLTIIPSDPEQPYFWDYESGAYLESDPLVAMYNYIYDLTDMFEKYGFAEQMLSKGTETYFFSEENTRMIEGMTYYIAIVPYANHELAGIPQVWAFEYSAGQ